MLMKRTHGRNGLGGRYYSFCRLWGSGVGACPFETVTMWMIRMPKKSDTKKQMNLLVGNFVFKEKGDTDTVTLH